MKIYLIYHSHIDNGYTERQERIGDYQANFIRQAVDLVLSDKQNKRSEREKFKFTAEGFWAVEQYLNKYGEKGKDSLIKAIKTGNFELTGCYYHLTELLDGYNLGHSLDYVQEFTKQNSLKSPKIAMAADINGFSYGFADLLLERNISCLSTNINVHHGGAPFGKPFVPFYWKTNKGGRVLVFSGMPYHKANLLGLIPGYLPEANSGIPGLTPEKASGFFISGPEDLAERRIFEFADYLKKEGYPLDFVPLMGSGLYTDNSPVSDSHCELISRWNEKHSDKIEIITSTQEEFFEKLKSCGVDIPEYSGDWSDWWSDGVLSMPEPLRLFRNAQRTQKKIRHLDPKGEIVNQEQLDIISKNLIYYAEHTYGHSASVSSPGELLVKQLEYRKVYYAVEADIIAGVSLDRIAKAFGEAEFNVSTSFDYKVINPNNQPVTSIVNLPIDYWNEYQLEAKDIAVIDTAGKHYEWQIAQGLRGKSVCCAVELAAYEQKKLSMVFGNASPAGFSTQPEKSNCFENDYYRLRFDESGIFSIINKKNNRELLKNNAQKLGQPIYQLFDATVRPQAAGANYSPRILPLGRIFEGKVSKILFSESGSVFSVLRVEYIVEGCQSYAAEFKLFHQLPRIELSVKYTKNLVIAPEGLYTAFPFSLPEGKWHLSKAGTFLSADVQLPSVCHDYFTVEKGVALTDGKQGICINTLDTPLVMLDELKLWKYSSVTNPSGCMYSWLLNNKWDTNFKAECAGVHESNYIIELVSGLKNPEDCEDILNVNELEPLVIRINN